MRLIFEPGASAISSRICQNRIVSSARDRTIVHANCRLSVTDDAEWCCRRANERNDLAATTSNNAIERELRELAN